MICQIEGCRESFPGRYFCIRHWKMIPLSLREEFWKQTDFGKEKPTPELLKRINLAVNYGP